MRTLLLHALLIISYESKFCCKFILNKEVLTNPKYYKFTIIKYYLNIQPLNNLALFFNTSLPCWQSSQQLSGILSCMKESRDVNTNTKSTIIFCCVII